jgi:hypothetical protein
MSPQVPTRCKPSKKNFFILVAFINCFDIALCGLIACGLLAMMWEENYGDDSSSKNTATTSK